MGDPHSPTAGGGEVLPGRERCTSPSALPGGLGRLESLGGISRWTSLGTLANLPSLGPLSDFYALLEGSPAQGAGFDASSVPPVPRFSEAGAAATGHNGVTGLKRSFDDAQRVNETQERNAQPSSALSGRRGLHVDTAPGAPALLLRGPSWSWPGLHHSSAPSLTHLLPDSSSPTSAGKGATLSEEWPQHKRAKTDLTGLSLHDLQPSTDLIPAGLAQAHSAPSAITTRGFVAAPARTRAASMPNEEQLAHAAAVDPTLPRPRRSASLSNLVDPGVGLADQGLAGSLEGIDAHTALLQSATHLRSTPEMSEDLTAVAASTSGELDFGGLTVASMREEAGKRIVEVETDQKHIDDGYRWRKYGQKIVKGNPHPRSYYKCTTVGCGVRKHVGRSPINPRLMVTTYEGEHTHSAPPLNPSPANRAVARRPNAATPRAAAAAAAAAAASAAADSKNEPILDSPATLSEAIALSVDSQPHALQHLSLEGQPPNVGTPSSVRVASPSPLGQRGSPTPLAPSHTNTTLEASLSPDPAALAHPSTIAHLSFEEIARLMTSLQSSTGGADLTVSQLLEDMPLGGFPIRSGAQDTTIGSLFHGASSGMMQTTTAIPVSAPAWPPVSLPLPPLERMPLRTPHWPAQSAAEHGRDLPVSLPPSLFRGLSSNFLLDDLAAGPLSPLGQGQPSWSLSEFDQLLGLRGHGPATGSPWPAPAPTASRSPSPTSGLPPASLVDSFLPSPTHLASMASWDVAPLINSPPRVPPGPPGADLMCSPGHK